MGVVRAWNSIAPFLGILVCFNGVPIIKCSNITFNLTINGTFGDLKAALLNKNVDFYKSKGMLHFDNIAHNLNIKNWINWKYPTFRLSEIHYGIPPYTCRFEQLNCTHDFNELNPVSFTFKDDEKNKKHFGFIAQELEIVYPELVTNTELGFKSVNYIEMIPILLSQMKNMQMEIDKLKEEIHKMKNEN